MAILKSRTKSSRRRKASLLSNTNTPSGASTSLPESPALISSLEVSRPRKKQKIDVGKADQRKQLSILERLPAELLEMIFVNSQEINLPAASPIIGRNLSSLHIRLQMCCDAFKFMGGSKVFGLQLMNQPWFTRSFLDQVVRRFNEHCHAHGNWKCSCHGPSLADTIKPKTPLYFLPTYGVPTKLLYGPWTNENIDFIFYLRGEDRRVNMGSVAVSATVARGALDAIRENRMAPLHALLAPPLSIQELETDADHYIGRTWIRLGLIKDTKPRSTRRSSIASGSESEIDEGIMGPISSNPGPFSQRDDSIIRKFNTYLPHFNTTLVSDFKVKCSWTPVTQSLLRAAILEHDSHICIIGYLIIHSLLDIKLVSFLDEEFWTWAHSNGEKGKFVLLLLQIGLKLQAEIPVMLKDPACHDSKTDPNRPQRRLLNDIIHMLNDHFIEDEDMPSPDEHEHELGLNDYDIEDFEDRFFKHEGPSGLLIWGKCRKEFGRIDRRLIDPPENAYGIVSLLFIWKIEKLLDHVSSCKQHTHTSS